MHYTSSFSLLLVSKDKRLAFMCEFNVVEIKFCQSNLSVTIVFVFSVSRNMLTAQRNLLEKVEMYFIGEQGSFSVRIILGRDYRLVSGLSSWRLSRSFG